MCFEHLPCQAFIVLNPMNEFLFHLPYNPVIFIHQMTQLRLLRLHNSLRFTQLVTGRAGIQDQGS